MIRRAVLLCFVTGQANAEIVCELTREMCRSDCDVKTVRFDVDAAQFVAPQSTDDPPRRQVTMVTLDGARFVAEAILMPNGARGFHEDAGALGSRLMIVQPDGMARLFVMPENVTYLGVCETS